MYIDPRATTYGRAGPRVIRRRMTQGTKLAPGAAAFGKAHELRDSGSNSSGLPRSGRPPLRRGKHLQGNCMPDNVPCRAYGMRGWAAGRKIRPTRSRAALDRNFRLNAVLPDDFGRCCSGKRPPCSEKSSGPVRRPGTSRLGREATAGRRRVPRPSGELTVKLLGFEVQGLAPDYAEMPRAVRPARAVVALP